MEADLILEGSPCEPAMSLLLWYLTSADPAKLSLSCDVSWEKTMSAGCWSVHTTCMGRACAAYAWARQLEFDRGIIRADLDGELSIVQPSVFWEQMQGLVFIVMLHAASMNLQCVVRWRSSGLRFRGVHALALEAPVSDSAELQLLAAERGEERVLRFDLQWCRDSTTSRATRHRSCISALLPSALCSRAPPVCRSSEQCTLRYRGTLRARLAGFV